MIRFALYCRKSHDDREVTEKSLQDQLKVWRELARERGFEIAIEYEESKSAKEARMRPLFDDMIRRIQSGEINGILTWHINRLTRNMSEGGLLADLLVAGKIQEIRTPHEVFRQQDNIMPLVMQAATATQNNRDHTEAVLRGVDSKFEAGGWNHRAPMGYLNQRDPRNLKRGIIVPDPERLPLLRQAWEMMLTGAYSVEEVVTTLNGRWGFRTRQTNERGGIPLTRSYGYKMFSNVFYAGYVHRDGRIQKGTHQPLVTLKEYHRVQEILQQRRKPRRTKRGELKPHIFPFTGIIRCGYCGQQVTAGLLNKKGRTYTYYRCSDSYRRCTKRGISQERIERQVTALLDGLTVDAELCTFAAENIARWLGEQSADTEASYQQLHRGAEAVESQLNNLLNLRLREVISDDALYKDKEDELVRERNRLRLAIREAEEELEHQRQTARNGYAYLAFARDHYLIADAETKKQLARAMGIEYVLQGNELSITVDPLLLELVKFAEGVSGSFEPQKTGSAICDPAFSGSKNNFGRTDGTVFEPGSRLQRLLKNRRFPRFEWPALTAAPTVQATLLAA